MATPVLNLDKYRDSFKTEEAFKAFASDFVKVVEGEMGLVVCEEQLIAALFPPEEAQKRIQEKIVRRVAQDPTLLDKIQERLESDDLVT